ncbi:hypothetical protein VDGL01_03380 [Verticillium dahliae]
MGEHGTHVAPPLGCSLHAVHWSPGPGPELDPSPSGFSSFSTCLSEINSNHLFVRVHSLSFPARSATSQFASSISSSGDWRTRYSIPHPKSSFS